MWDIIIERKSYAFKGLETKFQINKDNIINLTIIVYINEFYKCKGIYIGSTQALNTGESLHRSSNTKTENRNLNISKHLW